MGQIYRVLPQSFAVDEGAQGGSDRQGVLHDQLLVVVVVDARNDVHEDHKGGILVGFGTGHGLLGWIEIGDEFGYYSRLQQSGTKKEFPSKGFRG